MLFGKERQLDHPLQELPAVEAGEIGEHQLLGEKPADVLEFAPASTGPLLLSRATQRKPFCVFTLTTALDGEMTAPKRGPGYSKNSRPGAGAS